MESKNTSYQDIYKLYKYYKILYEYQEKHADFLCSQLSLDEMQNDDGKYAYDKEAIRFFDACTKRDCYYAIQLELEKVIARFPDTARAIYGE